MSSDHSQAVIVAVVCFIGGVYLIASGVLAFANKSIKIPGFYQAGIFLTAWLYGKDKVISFEEEMKNRKKAVRYGVMWTSIGLLSLALGIFVLFVE
jgi:hypothetical protein